MLSAERGELGGLIVGGATQGSGPTQYQCLVRRPRFCALCHSPNYYWNNVLNRGRIKLPHRFIRPASWSVQFISIARWLRSDIEWDHRVKHNHQPAIAMFVGVKAYLSHHQSPWHLDALPCSGKLCPQNNSRRRRTNACPLSSTLVNLVDSVDDIYDDLQA